MKIQISGRKCSSPTPAARVAGVGRGAGPLARRHPFAALVSRNLCLLGEVLHLILRACYFLRVVHVRVLDKC